MRVPLIVTLLCAQFLFASCASLIPAERGQALEQQLARSSAVHSVRAVFWGNYGAIAESTVQLPVPEPRYSRQAWERLRE